MDKFLKVCLLSLAGGTYKILEAKRAYAESQALLANSVGLTDAETSETLLALKELCIKDDISFYAISALGAAVSIWFLVENIIDIDENGSVNFQLSVLSDRYNDS